MHKILKFCLTLLSATVLANPAFTEPLRVVDDRGAEVTLQAAPKRVAALSIPAIDMLVALDQRPAAIATYKGKRPIYLGDAIDQAIDLGEGDGPNMEVLIRADVDLTIGMTRYNAPFAEDFESIAAFMAMNSITMEDSFRNVEQMAAILGAPETGKALNADFRAMLEDYTAKAPGGVSVMLLWAYQDFLLGYQNYLMPSPLFPALKARNVLHGKTESLTEDEAIIFLEAEDVLAADPDVLLVFSSHGGVLKSNPAFERLKAMRGGRAYAVMQQYSQAGGPIARRLVLQELANLLYPEVFPAPTDLPEAARATPLKFAQ